MLARDGLQGSRAALPLSCCPGGGSQIKHRSQKAAPQPCLWLCLAALSVCPCGVCVCPWACSCSGCPCVVWNAALASGGAVLSPQLCRDVPPPHPIPSCCPGGVPGDRGCQGRAGGGAAGARLAALTPPCLSWGCCSPPSVAPAAALKSLVHG